MKTIMPIGLFLSGTVALAGEPGRGVCLPNSAVVGMVADAAFCLVQTNAPSHAARPVAVQVLISGNRNVAVTATYRDGDVSYSDVKRAVADSLGRSPDTENANSAYWTVRHANGADFTASISHQSEQTKMTFAEHPSPPGGKARNDTEHPAGG